VHKNYRRRKIAQRLLDGIRGSFLFGQIVERAQVAFTQLTADGFLFAKSYLRQELVPCYQPPLH
jgi:hypothetical protein